VKNPWKIHFTASKSLILTCLEAVQCPLLGKSGQGWILACDNLSVFDPKADVTTAMAALAQRAPTLSGICRMCTCLAVKSYNSAGSLFSQRLGRDLLAIVEFYNQRFNLGFTEQQKSDFVAFLETL